MALLLDMMFRTRSFNCYDGRRRLFVPNHGLLNIQTPGHRRHCEGGAGPQHLGRPLDHAGAVKDPRLRQYYSKNGHRTLTLARQKYWQIRTNFTTLLLYNYNLNLDYKDYS
jgi:hypothetical protein